MFTKCTVRRRSAKKRWALRVAWRSYNPKIWCFGPGYVGTVRSWERGPRPRLGPKVACSRCGVAPAWPFSRALQLLPRRPRHRGRAQRVAPSALRSVIIGSAGREQVEATTQLEIFARLRGRVLGVVRLDSHQPCAHPLGNDSVAVGQAGMSEGRNPVRLADPLHRVHRAEAPTRDVGGATLLQVLVERLAPRPHVATPDHHLGHVGTPGRALLAHGEDLGGLDWHPELSEPLGDAMHASDALGALLAKEVLKPGGLVIDEVPEHVDLGALDVAVDLEAGDDRHPVGRRQRHRVGEAVGGIVVGDGEHSHAVLRSRQHQLAGRERTVRCRRVGVEVDGAAAHAVRYASRVRTATPVPPLGASGRALSLDAGAGVSTWGPGGSPANSLRNRPAVMAPPPPGPTLFRSATSLLRDSRDSSTSGRSPKRSPARSAGARNPPA